jgi:dipeptidyl aminopeptidase/acylaminoacyl peptidase
MGLALLALVAGASAQSLSLEQVMADPDWIGPPVEQAWLALDGEHAYYRVKQSGSVLRQLRRIDLGDGADAPVADADLAGIDGPEPVFSRDRRHAAFLRNGDLFVRELASGRLRQLTRGIEDLAEPRFADDRRVQVRAGERWLSVAIEGGPATPLADLRFEAEPDSEGADDDLRQTQLRLFESLARLRAQRAATRDEEARVRDADPSRAPLPWYLGKGRRLVASEPSPDGRFLLISTEDGDHKRGDAGKMPRFVTESGFTEVEDVRTRVGREPPAAQRIELLDLQARERTVIDLAALPGIDVDPLADLRAAAAARAAAAKAAASAGAGTSPAAAASAAGKPDAGATPRPVSLMAAQWSPDGRHVALMLRANDNKDRWLATLAPARNGGAVSVQHRLTDPAWINWSFNAFGWMPQGDTLWYQSEHTGWSHLYVKPLSGPARALTHGDWEVHAPELSADGGTVYFIGNAGDPTRFDLYSVATTGRTEPRRLTELGGVERFVLSADGRQVLLAHSASYLPTQLSQLQLRGGEVTALTDTRTNAYKAIEWPGFEMVAVPSSHQDRPVWSKLYRPRTLEPGRTYPAVLFVHGAGYTQNSHQRFPYYFREQMFHHLLVEAGYIVLDMDYRASAGYGRDWRTAIYRQMGHPELEDLLDGIDWLAAEHQVDPARIGVYGGSYGGFMTLMALFREPDRFAAGAALRPVTDWRHYNHGYTANILNTPQLDPEAHRKSSPIEYAQALADPLLIGHGMLDDNVFYQDSVMLAQRLIDLGKQDWELAGYPLEPHGYVQPESWLDQYRRILKLFNQALKP